MPINSTVTLFNFTLTPLAPKIVLGIVTDKEFEENHAIWQSLFNIADKYNGFVFVHGSVLLPNGAVLVGPMLDENT